LLQFKPMFISKLSLRNYRNFRNASLDFNKGINTLIGENGCGKTNVMTAIRILLDESLPRTYRFYDTDFNRSIGNWRGHWIIIQLYFEELDHGDEAQALALHTVGSPEEYDSTHGSCAVIFRPKYEIRNILYELSQKADKDEGQLSEALNGISLDDYELVYTARSNADFSDDKIYNKHVGDFKKIKFPNPSEQNHFIYGNKLYIGNFTKEVSCTFVKALRDVEADLRSYRDNPLVNLLRGKEKSIKVKTKGDIISKVKDLNKQISSLTEVIEVSDGVAQNIRTSVGETYAPGISIRSELPDDMEKLMQSLKLWVGDSVDEPYLGRISELSLGGANLIYLSTKLLEYEKVKAQDRIANFLLIEEPEAHIHTHIQKTLFEKIPEGRTQVIISTHSAQISSVSKISSVNIISKHSNFAIVHTPAKGIKSDEITRIERYLDAVRGNLLFAKSVVLVEGDAEQILIPILFKKIFGISLDEIGISLVNIGSTGFKNIARLFHEDRVRKRCAILTDLDESVITLPENMKDDNKIQRNCRNSEVKGQHRQKALNAFVKDNPYLSAHYATNTFEVQLLKSGNTHEVQQLVLKHTKDALVAEEINKKLANSDLNISGFEILRLAHKYKKGWFAIMLGDHINHLSYLPSYILQALNFSCSHLTLNTWRAIALKRYMLLLNNPYADDITDYAAIITALKSFTKLEELKAYILKTDPHDQFTQLINGV